MQRAWPRVLRGELVVVAAVLDRRHLEVLAVLGEVRLETLDADLEVGSAITVRRAILSVSLPLVLTAWTILALCSRGIRWWSGSMRLTRLPFELLLSTFVTRMPMTLTRSIVPPASGRRPQW